MGLNPRARRSRPEPRVDAEPPEPSSRPLSALKNHQHFTLQNRLGSELGGSPWIQSSSWAETRPEAHARQNSAPPPTDFYNGLAGSPAAQFACHFIDSFGRRPSGGRLGARFPRDPLSIGSACTVRAELDWRCLGGRSRCPSRRRRRRRRGLGL